MLFVHTMVANLDMASLYQIVLKRTLDVQASNMNGESYSWVSVLTHTTNPQAGRESHLGALHRRAGY